MKKAAVLLFVATLASGSQTKQELVAKTKRVDAYRVIITCENGADPTGVGLGHNTIMITCTDERK
jgi:hypothetical protein